MIFIVYHNLADISSVFDDISSKNTDISATIFINNSKINQI